MKIEIKLYSYHDMDLVFLYRTGRLAFPAVTREILNAYANGIAFRVLLRPELKSPSKEKPYRKYCHYVVTLRENQDSAAITLLKDITPGCRNNFVKTLLRQYICCPVPSVYSVSGVYVPLFEGMPDKFQAQMEEKNVGNIPQKKKPTAKKQNLKKVQNLPQKKNEKSSLIVAKKVRKKPDTSSIFNSGVSPNAPQPEEENVDTMLFDMMEEY